MDITAVDACRQSNCFSAATTLAYYFHRGAVAMVVEIGLLLQLPLCGGYQLVTRELAPSTGTIRRPAASACDNVPFASRHRSLLFALAPRPLTSLSLSVCLSVSLVRSPDNLFAELPIPL